MNEEAVVEGLNAATLRVYAVFDISDGMWCIRVKGAEPLMSLVYGLEMKFSEIRARPGLGIRTTQPETVISFTRLRRYRQPYTRVHTDSSSWIVETAGTFGGLNDTYVRLTDSVGDPILNVGWELPGNDHPPSILACLPRGWIKVMMAIHAKERLPASRLSRTVVHVYHNPWLWALLIFSLLALLYPIFFRYVF